MTPDTPAIDIGAIRARLDEPTPATWVSALGVAAECPFVMPRYEVRSLIDRYTTSQSELTAARVRIGELEEAIKDWEIALKAVQL